MSSQYRTLVGACIFAACMLVIFPGVGEASLEDAHRQALAAYRAEKSVDKAIEILEVAGAKSIVQERSNTLNDAKYSSLLNDYGFFLSETSDRWQEAIPILEEVVASNPTRYVAHLNLGDVYAKAAAATSDAAKQIELNTQVRAHYKEYARLMTGQKGGGTLPARVKAFLQGGNKGVKPPQASSLSHELIKTPSEGVANEGLQLQSTIKGIGLELPLAFDGKHIIFSRYDKSGNGKELVFLNPRTGNIDESFGGLSASYSHYLYSDEQYVITRDIGPPHRLRVFDRTQKLPLREIKFNQRIAGAFVRDGKFYVTQNNNPYHLSDGGQALTYDLSTGKLLSNVPVIPSNAMLQYGNQVILIGYEIKAYDNIFKEMGSFPKPAKSRELNGICEIGPAKIAVEKLIVGVNCGDIAIYDLKTRTLERTIPAFDPAFFNSFDVVGDLLFVAPGASGFHSPNNARIFDLQTGHEKAILDTAGYFIAIDRDVLISVSELSQMQSKYNTLAIYRMEKDRLIAGDTRLKKLMVAYEKAKGFAVERDSYRAIDVIDEAGLPALLASGKLDESIQPIVEDYARWLADTFERFAEAIPMVERFRLKYPQDESWVLLLSDLFRKQYEIAGDKVAWGKAIAAYKEYQRLYGQAPGMAKREFVQDQLVIKSADVLEVSIVAGSLPEPMFFHEERVYIRRYDCMYSKGGVSLEVFERNTFRHLQSIQVAGCDDEYQDNIGNIRFSKTQILLDLEYRYESEGRPNLVVVDKTSLTILAKLRREVQPPGQLQGDMSVLVRARREPYEVTNSEATLLVRFKPHLKDSPVAVTYKSLIFIGVGHDLLILDGVNKRIAHYERNFIPQGFEDNGHGLDTNRIALLIVDGDRLIARTFYGNHSRILDLNSLMKSLGLYGEGTQLQRGLAVTFTAGFLGVRSLTVEEDVRLLGEGGEGSSSLTLVQPEYVHALARIAEVEAGIGKGESANETLRKARDAAQTLLDPQQRALAHVTLAHTHAQFKQITQAEAALEQAEAALEKMDRTVGLVVWPKVAHVYAMLPEQRHKQKATDTILKTREILPGAVDFVKTGVLLAVAEAEYVLSHREASVEALHEAAKTLPSGSDFLEARVLGLLNIVTTQAAIEGRDAALSTIRQAVLDARGIASKTTRVQMLAAISTAQVRLGDKPSAKNSLAEAQKVGAIIKKDSNRDRVAAAVARAKAALRQFDEAEQLLASNHTGTWSYQEAFREVAKEEARAGELNRAVRMALRYTTLSEGERVLLVGNIAETLLIALHAGSSGEEVAESLNKVVYNQLAKLSPFH